MKVRLGIVGILLLVSACSEHGQEYYESHLDEAEKKMTTCNDGIKKALMNDDANSAKVLSEDAECRHAESAFRKHERKIREQERQLQHQQREAEQKAKAEQFEKDYAKEVSSMNEMSYQDFFATSEECRVTFSFDRSPKCKAYNELQKEKLAAEVSRLKNQLQDMSYKEFSAIKEECRGLYGHEQTPKCTAYNELRKEKDAEEISNLKKQYTDGKLEEKNAKFCKGLEYNADYCSLSQKAVEQQQKEKVEHYLENRQLLKKDFNSCRDDFLKSQETMSVNDARKAALGSYTCITVQKAARKLRILNFSEAIE